MAFFQGKSNIFELVDIIKNKAISNGWSVLKEAVENFDDIPRDGKYCIIGGSTGSIGINKSNPSNGTFNVIFPREIKPVSLTYNTQHGQEHNVKLNVYGILHDQTKELIAQDISLNIDNDTGAMNNYFFNANIKKYIQLEFRPTGSNKNIYDLHMSFSSDFDVLSKYVVLTNNNDNNNVILHLKAFLDTNGRANLAIATSTGFSDDLDIESQINGKVGYILSDDNELEYFCNINNSRLIITSKIERLSDQGQQNEIWQIGYFGRIKLYGGEWSLPDCNAVICSSFENIKFNETFTTNITNPSLYFSGAFNEVNSTSFSRQTTNMTSANIEAHHQS